LTFQELIRRITRNDQQYERLKMARRPTTTFMHKSDRSNAGGGNQTYPDNRTAGGKPPIPLPPVQRILKPAIKRDVLDYERDAIVGELKPSGNFDLGRGAEHTGRAVPKDSVRSDGSFKGGK
jgi:hypothetical protein